MEAVRKNKVKRTGRQIIIDLPDDFKAQEMDVIILPSLEETGKDNSIDLDKWRKKLREAYSNFNVSLEGFKFNRDELYER